MKNLIFVVRASCPLLNTSEQDAHTTYFYLMSENTSEQDARTTYFYLMSENTSEQDARTTYLLGI